MNSCVNKSAGVFTGAVYQRTQTRDGREVEPSQTKRRGSALRLARPVNASLTMLRENDPSTVPSRATWA
jgi:hypothetical protein